MDTVYLGIAAVFFVAVWLLVNALAKLQGGTRT